MLKFKILPLFVVLLITQIGAQAQFSITTEIAYLNHINAQNRRDLIENNIPNAELAWQGILKDTFYFKQGQKAAVFLYELSSSYDMIGRPALALHRLLVQRCLYSNDSISELSKNRFGELCYQNEFNQSFAEYLWMKSSKESLSSDVQQNLLLLTSLSTQMHLKELRPYILQLGNQMRLMDMDIPAWYNDWEYLVMIRLKEKHIKPIINYDNVEEGELEIAKIKSEKIKMKVFRKSIKHYIRNNSFKHAHDLVIAYQKENQNWFESLDLEMKKLRIWLRW